MYTIDDIFDMADGCACGEQPLKAKDEARFQVGEMIFQEEGYDIESEECPEDCVLCFCRKHNIQFDEDGNIIRGDD